MPSECLSLTFTVPVSVGLDSFDLICTTCFQVLYAEDENINEMPKHWWLAARCEGKCLLA